MNIEGLKNILEFNYIKYNTLDFIETDPIQIPHNFSKKEDIEISAFLVSTIAWGKRELIIRSGYKMIELLDNSPYEFIINCTQKDLQKIQKFVHRTFNNDDFIDFIKALKKIYIEKGGLEKIFIEGFKTDNSVKSSLIHFRNVFTQYLEKKHSFKHISDVAKKSTGKRLNLFLMWMVRKDNVGVHFGLWKKIPMSALMLPLDIHTKQMAQHLGLLTRKQTDWLAVEEITNNLRKFDPFDPVKYDFALFGMDLERTKKNIFFD